MAIITIGLTDRKLFTLYPDGTDMVQLQDPTEFDKNSIGERKRIELTYSSSVSIITSQIYFNPALFAQSGSLSPAPNIPSQFWSFYVYPFITAGTYNMSLLSQPPYNTNLYKNWTVKFVYINSTSFKIFAEFYQIYDENGFLNISTEDNRYKLTKDSISNGVELAPTLAIPSIYTDASYLPQFYIYIDKLQTADYGYLNSEITDYKAAFYNKNPLLAAPYFSLPVFTLEDSSGTISTMSLSEDTKVTFGITAPAVVDKVFIWLIKTSANDNTTDFISAYDASYLNVVANAGTGTLDNKIKAPSTDPTLNAGKYEVSFYVDYTQLTYGEKYRFIAVVYDSGYGNVEVNSFISSEYELAQLPQFTGTGYVFSGKIDDYESEYQGNDLTCIVEERLKSKLRIAYDYNVFSDDISNRLKLSVSNDIRKYLSKITVEVYENDGTYIQYFERLTAIQIDPVNYNVPSGMTLNFIDGELEVVYDFRVRYESWYKNLETWLGTTQIIPANADQNWAGRDLRIKYSLELFYYDYSTPFSDTIIFEQKLAPKDYGAEISIVELPDKPIGDGDYFCSSDEYVCLEAKLTGVANPEDYDLIVTIEPEDGNSPTLEENEGFNGILPIKTSDKILTTQTEFSETISGAAYFCIIPTKFFINLPYKISAIAKLRLACERITEDEFLRLGEDDQIRIMENCS